MFLSEQMPRMGPRAFRRENTDVFSGLPGENKNGEDLYKSWIGVFKSALPKGSLGHPDIHFVPMKGLKSLMTYYLMKTDSKHLNYEGNRKMMAIIKSKTLSAIRKFCMRDLALDLGDSWLPSVTGLVKQFGSGVPFALLK